MQAPIAGKTVTQWKKEYPLLEQMMLTEEVFWTNPHYDYSSGQNSNMSLTGTDIDEAEQRLYRFAPYIAAVFPETRPAGGMIESPLVKIDQMRLKLEKTYHQKITGSLYLKCDSHLPISGSVKARGGIYEVLKVAEQVARKNNMLPPEDQYACLAGDAYKKLFSQYAIIVGSTGNLGLSIGIMGAALGFRVIVHMSADARQWKKELLRSKGVQVVEHRSDYTEAVKAGRREAQQSPASHFVDDENSRDLFLGYAVAARRLKRQLEKMNIPVDQNHPLFVYLPCGVGGGPGGITFGLKTVFKDHVHCFFAEPTHSPAMLLGLMTGLHDKVSVQDFGIDNMTAADGLAVGRPSGFVGKTLEQWISGVFTVDDRHLYLLLKRLADSEKLYLEPSALAGCAGPVKLLAAEAGKQYLEKCSLSHIMHHATHIVWATGGSMVPAEVMEGFYQKGATFAQENG